MYMCDFKYIKINLIIILEEKRGRYVLFILFSLYKIIFLYNGVFIKPVIICSNNGQNDTRIFSNV